MTDIEVLSTAVDASGKYHDLPSDFIQKMFDRASRLGKIGVWECDLATERLTWTDTVYDLFDVPRGVAISREATLACYEPNSRREMERLRTRAIENCSSFTVDVAIRTALGNARWIRITGDVEQENGRAVRIFGAKQDITCERVAQLQLQAVQAELSHLSHLSTIDAVGSTLAHELNQPVAAIAIYVSALKNLLEAEQPERATTIEILNEMENCALKAGEIIRAVRNMAVREKPSATVFNLGKALEEACRIAFTGMSVEPAVTCVIPDNQKAFGDLVQIQQVIINLLKNAREAMAGQVKQEIEIIVTNDGGIVEVAVRDNGPGIAAEVMETMFDTFVSSRPEGTGIGLAISRTIIEAHSGSLSAENNLGPGSTFRFKLPPAPDPFPSSTPAVQIHRF